MSTNEQQRGAGAEAAMEQARKLRAAYAAVFGADDASRNELQRLVIADMEHRGYIYRPMLVPGPDGKLCEQRISATEGQRIFVLNTLQMIRQGAAASVEIATRKPVSSKARGTKAGQAVVK